jgi:epoxide hydrolase
MRSSGPPPQAPACALTDSPAGQPAWIAEKSGEWTDPPAELPDDAAGRDLILTDVSVYRPTGTAGPAARICHQDARTGGQPQPKSPVPAGVAVFPHDTTIRPLADRDHNVVHWAEFTRGGHFAAQETPRLPAGDAREFFRPFRRHPPVTGWGQPQRARPSRTARPGLTVVSPRSATGPGRHRVRK